MTTEGRRWLRLHSAALVLLLGCSSLSETEPPLARDAPESASRTGSPMDELVASPSEAASVAQLTREMELEAAALAEPSTGSDLPMVASRSDILCAEGVDEDIAAEPAPCPPEMAHIGSYCIDRWEAHLVFRGPSGELTVHPHYQRLRDGVRYKARSAPGVFPQGYISRVESRAACEAAGKRLCTWIEWRRACQGPGWFRYPYGHRFVEGACNHVKEHLLPRFFGHDPRRWKQADFNDPRLNQEPGFLARTGTHPDCISPDGVCDAVGNLHEWVIDRVTVRFMERLATEGVPREKQPWRAGNGMFLGGFYSTRGEHGPGCHFTTVAHGPSYHDYSTGFRCCRDAVLPAADSRGSD